MPGPSDDKTMRFATLCLMLIASTVLAVSIFSSEGSKTLKAADSDAVAWMSGVHFDYGLAPDWRSLLSNTSAAVIGVVTDIASPRFNSDDGEYWEGDHDTTVFVYSTVRFAVQEVLVGEVPNRLTLLAMGDARIRTESNAVPHYDGLSGGFNLGESYLLILRQREVGFESGLQMAWVLAADFEGNWRLSGNDAIGSYLPRSLQVEQLRSIIETLSSEAGG